MTEWYSDYDTWDAAHAAHSRQGCAPSDERLALEDYQQLAGNVKGMRHNAKSAASGTASAGLGNFWRNMMADKEEL